MESVGRRERFIDRRKYLGLTQESLAHAIEVSVSSIAQWERGVSTPSPRHRPRLGALLQVSLHELDRLLDPMADPFEIHGHLVPPHMIHFVSLEQAAAEVRSFEPISIPGLLQTPCYAEAAFRSHYEPLTEEQIASRVGTRLARQKALVRSDRPLRLRTILDESVLMRSTDNPRVMVEQLDHLLAMAALPNVEVHLLPLASTAHCVAWGSFWMLTKPGAAVPFMLCTEDASTMHYSELPVVLADHSKLFDHLTAISLGQEATARRVAAARETYR